MNKKSLYSVAATMAVYLVAYVVARPDVSLRGGFGLVACAFLVVLPSTALVLAGLSIREIRASRKAKPKSRGGARGQHYWPAFVALLLAFSFIGPFGFYGVTRWRHDTALRASSSAPAWTTFTSKPPDFVALFPVAPTESTQTVPRPGGPVSLHVVMASMGPDESYSVMRVDAPKEGDESTTATLDRLEADFAKRNGNVRARADVSAGSVPGRELRIDTAEKSLRVRLFAAKGHVYQVLVMRPLSVSETASDTRFLESFTIQGP